MTFRWPRSRATAGSVRCLMILLLLALPRLALAHQTSIKYGELAIHDATIEVSLRGQPDDVTEPLGQAADAKPAMANVTAASATVAPWVIDWLAISAQGQRCQPGPATLAVDPDDGRFFVARATFTCPEAVTRIELDFARFFTLDASHSVVLRLTAPETSPYETIIRSDTPQLAWTLGEDGPSTFLAWIKSGTAHIWEGHDHIAFVLVLLLVVVLTRTDGQWTVRPLGPVVRHTAAIVTAFTVAHSLTLIAASMGWISLPGRLVESAIAVSIAYTAVENIIKPDVRWRFVLTFAFGLIHGLGFASVLAEILPRDHVIVPLLAFNIGVELGQLAIVAVGLPLLWLLARLVTAPRYRRWVMPAASVGLAILGILWLVERVAEVDLLGGF